MTGACKPLATTRSRPLCSVTNRRPSGAKARAHGSSKPVATSSVTSDCCVAAPGGGLGAGDGFEVGEGDEPGGDEGAPGVGAGVDPVADDPPGAGVALDGAAGVAELEEAGVAGERCAVLPQAVRVATSSVTDASAET